VDRCDCSRDDGIPGLRLLGKVQIDIHAHLAIRNP
jgi:hypothetical protein